MHTNMEIEVNTQVVKISGKPFKNGNKVQLVYSFGTNENDPKERECAIFEDGSVCNVGMLKLSDSTP